LKKRSNNIQKTNRKLEKLDWRNWWRISSFLIEWRNCKFTTN